MITEETCPGKFRVSLSVGSSVLGICGGPHRSRFVRTANVFRLPPLTLLHNSGSPA